MKITIEQPPFSYSACWDYENKVEGGFIEEYNVPVDEAVDAALSLLAKVYSNEEVAAAIRKTDFFNLHHKEGE